MEFQNSCFIIISLDIKFIIILKLNYAILYIQPYKLKVSDAPDWALRWNSRFAKLLDAKVKQPLWEYIK